MACGIITTFRINIKGLYKQFHVVFPSYRNGQRQLVASGSGYVAAAESEGNHYPILHVITGYLKYKMYQKKVNLGVTV